MQSMTGYGKAEYKENGKELTVEIKTVNNRFLDVIPKYPRCFVAFDDAIRKTVQAKIKRGRAELFVSYSDTSDSGKKIFLDDGVAAQYVEIGEKVSEKYGVENDLTAVSLMRLPDVLTEEFSEPDAEVLSEILEDTLNRALDNLNKMRSIEGLKLKEDVLKRCANVENLLFKVEKRAPELAAEYKSKLKAKVEETLSGVKYDEARLLQEVTIFADKTNIDEEITRLKSHIAQCREICESTEDVGKKLDFLMQEFNRETNTICSKANDIAITGFGLSMKNEIEKMREQVQNIE
ncbi:MAG TPA: YicC family protein [Clostridiales bacterium]|nr:YicC family protein [Clostridiales bacterium]